MNHLRRALVPRGFKQNLAGHLSFFRRLLRFLWDSVLSCSASGSRRYRRLRHCPSAPYEAAVAAEVDTSAGCSQGLGDDSDLVVVKVSLLGDCHVGKTTFMLKYLGDVEEHRDLQMAGLCLMHKILPVKGVRIAFNIWDCKGDRQFFYHVPIACKDAAAILIMFDLTRRCTLNNAIGWYRLSRRWNKTSIPILIGTKFDDFVHLPPDMQWTVVNQARAYARAMRATLFFSSSTHGINVSKIFKFIVAQLFNLPWAIQRNLTFGEPVVDFLPQSSCVV